MPILFLDFDGVLHPEHCHESKHFSCLPVLEDVLRKAPEWQVVITSTWRLTKPLDQLQGFFSPDIAARVVGETPRFSELTDVPSSLLGYQREAECHAWLRDNDLSYLPWLGLDDRSWLYRPFCKTLFLVNGKTGLTWDVADQLAISGVSRSKFAGLRGFSRRSGGMMIWVKYLTSKGASCGCF